MAKEKNETFIMIASIVGVLFLLLAALFGSQIMTFIFGALGPDAAGLTVADAAYNASIQVQNNSLQSIVVYTASADTQMSTVSITIVLLLLIGLFLIFWKSFIGGGKGGSSVGGGNFA